MERLPNYHPILVHFTVALLSVAVALYVLLALADDRLPSMLHGQWAVVARWNLWLGANATVFTVAAGFHAFGTVTHDAISHAAMKDHRNWALATFTLFLALAGWSVMQTRAGQPNGKGFVVLLLAAQLVLLATAWRGGELVYRHGLGVLSLPDEQTAAHTEPHEP